MGLLLACCSTAEAAPVHDKVKGHYKNKQYHLAVKVIDKVESPDQLLHYYRALCLQATGRVSAAKSEYDWVCKHGSNATLKSHAAKGLKQLGGIKTSKSATAEANSHSSSFDSRRLDPRTFFFTQVYDPKYNYKAQQYTKQCGPTCLAMVFKRFGKLPPGAKSFAPQELINASRLLMTGSSFDRGTLPKEVKTAAEKLDFHGEYLADVNAVANALDTGSMVIMAGCPFPYSYGHRVGYRPFRNGHFVLLVCRKAGQFICNDPAYKNGPIALSSGEVNNYTMYRKSTHNYLALRPMTEEEKQEKLDKEEEEKEKKKKGKTTKKK